MTVIATDAQRLSNVMKWVDPNAFHVGLLTAAVTIYEGSQKTYVPGQVLGRTLVSGSGAWVVQSGTLGNGTPGTVTVSGYAKVGTYVVRFLTSGATAAFSLRDPDGRHLGQGAVGTAFVSKDLSFTIADGATDYSAGEVLLINVTGTEKWKTVEATAVDGSEVAAGIYIGTVDGESKSVTIAATTDTKGVILARGPAIVSKGALVYGSSVNTTAELTALYGQLKSLNIFAEDQLTY